MSYKILQGHVLDVLRTLPDESVHCCITSPPYWGLRQYIADGAAEKQFEIGLEPTPDAFVARMVEVFREVRRVLRSDGTLWLNMGDSYATSISGHKTGPDGRIRPGVHDPNTTYDDRTFTQKPFSTVAGGLKPKDLCGMPWRVAFALQADGWWLRGDYIWSKPNPMPESVTDRCTKSHEYIFHLAKSERYYHDGDAIREPYNENSVGRYKYALQGTAPTCRQIGGDVERREREKGVHDPNPLGRNKRSVWTVATAPYADAHFATFPPELIEPMIKAGTSQHGCCAECGAPWARETERGDARRIGGATGCLKDGKASGPMDRSGNGQWDNGHLVTVRDSVTLGWSPSCSCNAEVKACTVLDPFSGAGTTCLVADRLQRNAIGIELNGAYAEMSIARLSKDRGGLLDFIDQPEQPKPKQLSLLEALNM